MYLIVAVIHGNEPSPLFQVQQNQSFEIGIKLLCCSIKFTAAFDETVVIGEDSIRGAPCSLSSHEVRARVRYRGFLFSHKG